MSDPCSRLPGFYRLGRNERIQRIAEAAGLGAEEQEILRRGGLTPEVADRLVENVVGVFGLPLGIATNLRVNQRDYLLPMVVEESSVVAAASSAAKLVRDHGSLTARADEPLMIAQIQLVDLPDREQAIQAIRDARQRLLDLADRQDPTLKALGGGVRDLELRPLETLAGPMLVVHLLVDVRDAMGANAVNTMAEALAPVLEELSGGRGVCKILSNLSDRRLVQARMEVDIQVLGKGGYSGEEVARRIVQAYAFAEADPYRATTHNKGIMNGIDAVLIATGNDWRAVEAGAHAHACRSGRYTSLSRYALEGGRLVGEVELPMAVGIVGGMTRLHPTVGALLALLDVRSAAELAEVACAAGLLQNFAALRSLASEGIQRGHMGLHARNLAISVGARDAEIEEVASRMIQEEAVRYDRAREILRGLRGGPPSSR